MKTRVTVDKARFLLQL